jgi:hypothetical protein
MEVCIRTESVLVVAVYLTDCISVAEFSTDFDACEQFDKCSLYLAVA